MFRRYATLYIIVLLTILYFFSRSINLESLPIFNDESTYIRYGVHQIKEKDHKPYSLTIGKEPLMPFLYAYVGGQTQDLLLGARYVTVATGFVTLLGLFYFVFITFGRRPALFTALFYILSPFTLFFDRMALMDSAVSAVAIWSLVLTACLLKKTGWIYALGLGVVMGIGLWIKASDFFYILLPLVSYGVYYFLRGDSDFKHGEKIGTALFIALVIFEPLFSNSLYMEHLDLMKQYTYPVYSVFFFPVGVWLGNLGNAITWLFFYLTPPLFLLGAATLFLYRKQKKLYLTGMWLVVPFVYEILYAKLFTSRHVLLLTVPLFIFAGYGMWKLLQKQRVAGIMVLFILVGWCLFYDLRLITSVRTFPDMFVGSAMGDISQYISGASSGYGVQEAISYLRQAAASRDIIVMIRNDHGNPEDAVVAYMGYADHARVLAFIDPSQVEQIFQKTPHDTPIYYVTRSNYYGGLEKYITSEKRFYKPDSKEFVGVSVLKH
jgi:hypothetical protein